MELLDDALFDKFIDDINETTYLQVILKGHLYVEHHIVELIKISLKNPNEMKYNKLSFPAKIDLLLALGQLEKDDTGPLLYLNTIRNKYAHNLNYQITNDAIEEMITKFSEITREFFSSNLASEEWDHFRLLRGMISMMYLNIEQKVYKVKSGEYLTDIF